MPFTIVRQDITRIQADAIVNAANTDLLPGGGVCGAIFSAAGYDELCAACAKAAPIRTGGAVITPAFRLPARYIIHAAGPVYDPARNDSCREELYSAYTASLELAEKHQCESVAFPLISSGIYGYPKEEALRVASSAVQAFLEEHEMTVYLCVFDRDSFAVSRQLLGEVDAYINEHYAQAHLNARAELSRPFAQQHFAAAEPAQVSAAAAEPPAEAPAKKKRFFGRKKEAAPGLDVPMMAQSALPLEDLIEKLDEPFSDTLFRLIDDRGKTDVEVYKRANIDRKLFSKIRTLRGYTPRKSTILALAVSLELPLEETEDLLRRAGYALSHTSKFDVIVEYFILNRRYDVFEINEILFRYDQPLLGP